MILSSSRDLISAQGHNGVQLIPGNPFSTMHTLSCISNLRFNDVMQCDDDFFVYTAITITVVTLDTLIICFFSYTACGSGSEHYCTVPHIYKLIRTTVYGHAYVVSRLETLMSASYQITNSSSARRKHVVQLPLE